ALRFDQIVGTDVHAAGATDRPDRQRTPILDLGKRHLLGRPQIGGHLGVIHFVRSLHCFGAKGPCAKHDERSQPPPHRKSPQASLVSICMPSLSARVTGVFSAISAMRAFCSASTPSIVSTRSTFTARFSSR